MPPSESPVSMAGCVHLGNDTLRTVVWIRGEHDIATRGHLSDTLAQAARIDDADILVDLSAVTFMDASTAGALVAARNRARASSRSLSVRDPSPRARRLLDLCGLAQLIDDDSAPPAHVATALGTWIDVPTQDRDSRSQHQPVAEEAPSQEAVGVVARRRIEPARSVPPPRASS